MSDSSSSSDDSESFDESFFEDVCQNFDQNKAIQPYSFEPHVERPEQAESDSSDEDSEVDLDISDAEHDRRKNDFWCTCENCQRMDKITECICCQEIPKVWEMCQSTITEGLQAATCIINHPGFLPVCTNKYVLKTAWMQYKQQYSDPYNGPEHKQFRHIAYRQLARWCWGYLGKEVRVVLPSCAVMCIRAHFPPPGLEDDYIFEGFHYADE